MHLDWQTAAVLTVIATATMYLARSAWQTIARKKAAACGGCAKCPSNPTQDEPQVVGLGQLSGAAGPVDADRNGTHHG